MQEPSHGMRSGESLPVSGIPASFWQRMNPETDQIHILRELPCASALDAMGGDFAPGPIVTGACEAVGAHPELTVVLVGDRERIEGELAKGRRTARSFADRSCQPGDWHA